jgi:hypothetical protein
MKAKGDLCLMAGSLQDAFDHYRWGARVCVCACECVQRRCVCL